MCEEQETRGGRAGGDTGRVDTCQRHRAIAAVMVEARDAVQAKTCAQRIADTAASEQSRKPEQDDHHDA